MRDAGQVRGGRTEASGAEGVTLTTQTATVRPSGRYSVLGTSSSGDSCSAPEPKRSAGIHASTSTRMHGRE